VMNVSARTSVSDVRVFMFELMLEVIFCVPGFYIKQIYITQFGG